MSSTLFTRKEVERRNCKDDAVIIIDNVVYNVTSFLEEHPGGADVLLDNAGRDASQCFHRVGHGEYAREWMKTFAIGEIVKEERSAVIPWSAPTLDTEPAGWTLSGLVGVWGAPVTLAAAALLLYTFLFAD